MKHERDYLTALEKFEAWFGQKALLITILFSVTVFVAVTALFLSLRETAKREAFYRKLLDRATKYAVVTDQVRIAVLKKEPLSAGIFKNYVRNEVENYFIIGRNDLLVNGKLPIFRAVTGDALLKEAMKTLEPVRKLAEFFNLEDKDSASALQVFVKYLYGEARSGTLPDTVEVSGPPTSEEFRSKESSFTYSVTIPVRVYWVGIDGKLHRGIGEVKFWISGKFEPEPGKLDYVNPYGMKVYDMKFSYVRVKS